MTKCFLSSWRAPLRTWPGVALSVWNVPLQLYSFRALLAARAAGHTVPSDEEKVAEVSTLSCADAPQRH